MHILPMQTSPQLPPERSAPGISTRSYFTGVALLSLTCLTCYILSKPLMKQRLGQALGIIEPPQAPENSFYQQRVQAVFDEYCIACHNKKKSKGALRLDNYLHARYSGKSGRAVVPFQPESSAILLRMSLPENNKRLMPPLGWNTPSRKEKRIVELWIAKGGTQHLSVAEVPGAPPLVKKIQIPSFDAQQVELARLPSAILVDNLMQRFPHSLTYISRNSHKLRFSSVSLPRLFTDNDLKQLAPIAAQLESLYLPNAHLTDASAKTLMLINQLNDAYLPNLFMDDKNLIDFISRQNKLHRLTLSSTLISENIKEICSKKNIRLSGLDHAQ